MLRFFIPILLFAASGTLFFGYIDPTYSSIRERAQEEALFDSALNNTKELQTLRDELRSKYNTFSTSDLDRLVKMVPNNVDNVRLVRDIDGIASKYGMSLYNTVVGVIETDTSRVNVSDSSGYGSVLLTFSVTGPYKTFLNFLKDLEKSLRIVDVVEVTFVSSEKDLYEYRISLQTYWLK
ncbi:MAG: type 4a pilus biogenesis protein PilO [Patescibacteria group bacterium]|nr:type 4a pilus biogenesis protein PilO [Patescibacteria group bacterium]